MVSILPFSRWRFVTALSAGSASELGGSEERMAYVVLLALAPFEPEHVALCRRCGVIFARAHDRRYYCSHACRVAAAAWLKLAPCWVDFREPLRPFVHVACPSCGAWRWERDPSRRYCESCGSGAARTARSRVRAARAGS